MKTAFALAFLAASSEADISLVTAAWKTTVHTAHSVLQICATHGTEVTSDGSNTISYQYVGAKCDQPLLKTATVAAELTWGTGDSIGLAGDTNAGEKTTCGIDESTKTVTCNMVGVAAGKVSCVNMKKCRPTERAAAHAGFKVKQSQTDTSYIAAANAAAGAAFAPAALTTLTVTRPNTADAWVGAPEFDFTLSILPATDIAVGKKVTVLVPGYTQGVGGTCKFGTGTASTPLTSEVHDTFPFDAVSVSATTATTLVCTKVKVNAAAAVPADQCFVAVIWGDSGLLTTEAKWVASPPITSGAPIPPTDSASTVSLSAAALLLTASMSM